MNFTITIDCSNDTFSDENGNFDQSNADAQVAQILEQIVKDVDLGKLTARGFPHNFITYRDANGNPVGTARYERT